ncbi:MAG: cytochrome c biogenesis CcdA family protein [Acidimicrobiales bacterium]
MGDLLDLRAFTLGMVALINPCGFALLPAYLGFFLGLDDGEEAKKSSIVALNRAQVVGLSMSAGFLVVFGVLGLFLAGTITGLQESGWLPRITVVVGVGLVFLGIAMFAGFQPLVKIPKLNKGGGSGSVSSMFVFGVSYAVASLSCTIGIFLGAIGNSASGASFAERFGSFLSYAVGMGLLATVLTLAVGFGKKGIVNRFRQLLPKINLFSAGILIVVGIYVALYGIWSEQVLDFDSQPTPWINSIVTTAEGWQASMAGWMGADISVLGFTMGRTSLLGWIFLVLNVGLAAAGFLARRNQSPTLRDPALADS